MIYKGNDNYYLEATSTNASKPDAGMIAGGSYADAVGTTALTANTWSYLTETYDGSTLQLYVNGTQVASVGRIRARSRVRPTRCRSAATASTASTSPA